MIKIKVLRWGNMFRYGSPNEFVFDEPVTLLNGPNGSGKSSIPAILEDLFYNKNSRGVKKGSLKNRNFTTKDYWSEAVFYVNDDSYVITKKVASTTTLILTKNGENISGHTATQTYAIVQELLGMDFQTFTKLVYQSMGSSLDFLLATDSNRKKFLVSLLGLERYAEIAKLVKEELTECKSELAGVEGEIKSYDGILQTPVPTKKPLFEVPEEILEIDFSGVEQRVAAIHAQNSKIEANNVAISRLDALKAQPVSCPEIPEGYEDKSAVENKLTELRGETAANNSELKKLSIPATHCHACGSELTTQEHVEFAKERKEKLQQTIQSQTKEQHNLAAQLATYQKYETELAKYNQYVLALKNAEQSVDFNLPTELVPWQSLLAEKDKHQAEVASRNAEIRNIEKLNSQIQIDNARADVVLENIANAEAKKKELVEGPRARLTDRIVLLEVLNKAFGTKGLISYKIESTTKIFEGLINDYLVELSQGRFNLLFEVQDTKLALKVFDLGNEVEINSLSSGEFNRVNTACLLAIRKMMSAVSKVNLNILFLDEVVSVLDRKGKDTLIEVLLKERELNSVVVSHGYSHPLAHKVYVNTLDGTSSLSEEANVE